MTFGMRAPGQCFGTSYMLFFTINVTNIEPAISNTYVSLNPGGWAVPDFRKALSCLNVEERAIVIYSSHDGSDETSEKNLAGWDTENVSPADPIPLCYSLDNGCISESISIGFLLFLIVSRYMSSKERRIPGKSLFRG